MVVVRSRRRLMDEYDDEVLQCSQPVLIIRVKLPRSGAYNWAPHLAKLPLDACLALKVG